ncbi:hypothetical protein ACFVIN_05115, partial [Streptomyces prasinus]|uniref:hypothetical protein n=1 Tax=Streptomyces prasinus TaxID=67345 RepID=UPI003631D569
RAGVCVSFPHSLVSPVALGFARPRNTVDAFYSMYPPHAWLASTDPNAALRRLVSESRAGVERALRAQAADAAAE